MFEVIEVDASQSNAVSNFILQALRNEPITVYGNGTQSRSFSYVDDLMPSCGQ